MLSDIIIGKIDILLISETKLGNIYISIIPNFKIAVFSNPFRRDRSSYGGLVMMV